MRLLSLAAMTAAVSGGLLFAACSGSSGVTFPDASISTNEGGQSSGNPPPVPGDSGRTDDGGIVCAPCPDDPPRADCTTADPCGCGPYTCPDAGAGEPCTWSDTINTCGDGRYCFAPGCAAGTCVPVGKVENTSLNPRCGCDGNTYWNGSIAAFRGVSIDRTGACNGGRANDCTRVGRPCTSAGASCELRVKEKGECPISPLDRVDGICWVTPTKCSEVIGPTNPAAHVCADTACPSECSAIKTNAVHYAADKTCPPG